MIISRESDYAIRILRALADGEKHAIGTLCETECIPGQFGYKIIEKLRRAGMVRCERGRTGGCYLDCDLHEVTLYDVLNTIDNDCCLNLCLSPGHKCPWEESHEGSCRVHRKLAVLQTQADSMLKSLDMHSFMFE